MIIQQVVAENILKYARLELKNLPQQGLIAISGANESGKTAIGETICLALFGRTFSLPVEKIRKMVKWGAIHSHIDLDFIINDKHYRITRHFDADGGHSAQLSHNDEVVSQGVTATQAQLNKIIGFNYEEFIDSFYLAQREITLPHPQGNTVKEIVGIKSLEQVALTLESEITHAQSQQDLATTTITNTNLEVTELNLDEQQLDKLKQDQSEQTTELQNRGQQRDDLKTLITQISEQTKALQNSAQNLLHHDVNTSYKQWQQDFNQQQNAFNTLHETLTQANDADATMIDDMHTFNQNFEQRLSLFERVEHTATAYQAEVRSKLDEQHDDNLLTQQQQLSAQCQQLSNKISRNKIVLSLCLLITLLSVAASLVLQFLPEHISAQWLSVQLLALTEATPQLKLQPNWLLWGSAALFALISILFIQRVVNISQQRSDCEELCSDAEFMIETAQHELSITQDLDSRPLAAVINQFDEAHTDPLGKLAHYFNTNGGAAFVNPPALSDLQNQLRDIVQQDEQQLETLKQSLQQIINGLEQENDQQRQRLDKLSECIVTEQARRQQATQLNTTLNNANQQLNDSIEQIRVRKIALNLIDGTCKRISAQFNHDLKAFVSHVTPKLTENRYQYLQLDEQLNVKIFSQQKNDFLNFEEVSSGTQRQVTLAMRIALSEALIAASIKAKQFMILDEPFAFFDQTRIRNALHTLPVLSKQLSQVWIVAQEFEEDAPIDLHIHCDPAQSELIY